MNFIVPVLWQAEIETNCEILTVNRQLRKDKEKCYTQQARQNSFNLERLLVRPILFKDTVNIVHWNGNGAVFGRSESSFTHIITVFIK